MNSFEAGYNMPRIKSIVVENVKAFKKLRLNFGPGLNIVSTHRGTGRTALVALLISASEENFMLNEGDILKGATTGYFSVDYEPFRHSLRKKYGVSWPYGILGII